MNKTMLLILTLILVACTPQVTVTSEVTVTSTPPPTETPIPTPTLHPEFVNFQESVAQTEKFTLTSPEDGLLYDGAPIPGVSVGRDGSVTLTLADGSEVTLEPSQVRLDDEAGFSAEGYKLDENGEWVVAVNAEQAAIDILDQYGVDPASYTMSEVDGVVSVVDNKTGAVLMESSEHGIAYSLEFAVDTIAKASCEPTDIVPNRDNGLASVNNHSGKFSHYFNSLTNESGVPGWTGITQQYFLIDRARQCWGRFYQTNYEFPQQDKVMIYRDGEGVVHTIPLLDSITWDEIYGFTGDR